MVLPVLIALKDLYHDLHWKAHSYQEHLMFQRLYESVDKEIDPTGELLAGTIGLDMTASERLKQAASVLDRFGSNYRAMEGHLQEVSDSFKARIPKIGHHFEQMTVNSMERLYIASLGR